MLLPNPADDTLVEIAFNTLELRSICESDSRARAELGDSRAVALEALIADLIVARSLEDLPAGRLKLDADRTDGQFTLSMGKVGQLIVERNHVGGHWTGDPRQDAPRISRIKVLRIEDCDEQ